MISTRIWGLRKKLSDWYEDRKRRKFIYRVEDVLFEQLKKDNAAHSRLRTAHYRVSNREAEWVRENRRILNSMSTNVEICPFEKGEDILLIYKCRI